MWTNPINNRHRHIRTGDVPGLNALSFSSSRRYSHSLYIFVAHSPRSRSSRCHLILAPFEPQTFRAASRRDDIANMVSWHPPDKPSSSKSPSCFTQPPFVEKRHERSPYRGSRFQHLHPQRKPRTSETSVAAVTSIGADRAASMTHLSVEPTIRTAISSLPENEIDDPARV
jgi:hypothetical protein